ncbi:MAG: metal ABC transporter ATP-binding protein [Candidatus Uhrbacteria bacterium]|nr:metal ABC transporter ATP-binding protein [Candidatus Uhrbacteria bacterium]
MSVDHTKNCIEIRDVSFRYADVPVLEHITLDIHEGDYLGMIGPNGGGKTTLLKVMLGLIKPSAGEVFLFGKNIHNFHEWPSIGYVPQKATHIDPLFPATVFEIVAMGRYGAKGLFNRLDSQDRARIHESLKQVAMEDYAGRRIGDLSLGQQQRVFIARALAAQPKIIILDEPTVGIDSAAQEQFYALLKTLNHDLGLTLILVSHDIDVVAHEVTEIACINQALVYHGNPKNFFTDDAIEHLYGKNARLISHNH